MSRLFRSLAAAFLLVVTTLAPVQGLANGAIQVRYGASSGGVGSVYVITGTGAGTWTVPATGHYTVEAIGGGADGGGTSNVAFSAPGGTGGQYAQTLNLALGAGSSISYQVGVHNGVVGTPTSPGTGDTWFDSPTSVLFAQGGGGGSGGGCYTPYVGVSTGNCGGHGNGGGFAQRTGGGGGGAGGPNGPGGSGGNSPGNAPDSGGPGGGGADGGTAGTDAAGAVTGYAGGYNRLGSGAGAGGAIASNGGAGTNGGGGGGGGSGQSTSAHAGDGGSGSMEALWTVPGLGTFGPGGGGGGGGNQNDGPCVSGNGGAAGGYGGGGGGAGSDCSSKVGGAGTSGIIVITRTSRADPLPAAANDNFAPVTLKAAA